MISLGAAGLVAALFHPLRERLQRGVNRLMHGERDDPYAVLSRLGERLESDGYQTGVGLTSMRERAAELGGTCVVEERAGGGTRVWAELAVSRET